MTSKELDRLDKRMDRLEDKLERLEIKLEQINLSEIIVKGREIEKIYSELNAIGVVDVFKIYNELIGIKQRLNYLMYHPWEWLERDPAARQAFFSRLEKKIADEISQAALFTLYEEQPNVVVNIVKDAVKEYLDIWEINDQVAMNIVSNVMKRGFFNELVKNVYAAVAPYIKNSIRQEMGKKLKDVKEILERDG